MQPMLDLWVVVVEIYTKVAHSNGANNHWIIDKSVTWCMTTDYKDWYSLLC